MDTTEIKAYTKMALRIPKQNNFVYVHKSYLIDILELIEEYHSLMGEKEL